MDFDPAAAPPGSEARALLEPMVWLWCSTDSRTTSDFLRASDKAISQINLTLLLYHLQG